MRRKLFSPERLRHLLDYDPEMGLWTWRNPPNHNTRLKGRLAGNRRSDGYLKIRIDGQAYYAGRLAWYYMTGEWPKDEIDHLDRNPRNDRWANLRDATSSQNKFNQTREGLVGVYRSGSGWWAQAGRDKYLGVFATLDEAITARAEALRSMS